MREENSENNRQYYDEYEIDLREYIILIWQKKWFILGLVVLAILAAFFYNLFFVQPVYEARATLLILPPRYTTSLEVKTFSADTYENLAQTDSIKTRIITNLSLKNNNGEEYSIDQLEDMMEVKLLSAAEEDRTPLVQLIVKNKDPELAAQIANSWAKLFMADSKEIRKSEVTEISSVIQQQFEETEDKLKGLKTKKLNFKEKSRLELLDKRLSNKENKLTTINQKVLDLKSELGFKKTKLTNLEEQLSKLEHDGNWEGDLSYNKKASDSAADYQQFKNKQRFLTSQQKLVEFKQKNNLGLLKLKIKNKEEKIISYQAKIADLENNLTTAIQENKHLEQFLKTESKTWQLNKSVDNQTLWQSILNQKDLAILDKLKLKNEIVNPIYKNTRQKFTNNQLIIDINSNLVDSYQQQIDHLTASLVNLRNKYLSLENKQQNLNKNITVYQQVYENYSKKYQELMQQKLDLELNVEELQATLIYYRQSESDLTAEIETLQNNLWQAENKIEELDQKIADVKNTYDSLAKRAEEARITEAQRTSDVKFYAKAVTPGSPDANNLMLDLAIAAVLAFMLAIFIIFFTEFIKSE